MDEPFRTTVHDLAEHVSAGIEQACLNGGSWDDVTRMMAETVPGSRSSIVGFNKRSGDINFQSTHNLEEKYIKSYRDHYWYCNPWNDFWAKAGTGILIAEETAPVRQYHHTEFYTDWLRPQRVFDAGACIRIGSDPDTIVYAAVQFDLKQQERYAPALRTFFEGIHGTFRRALQLGRLQAGAMTAGAARGALAQRFSDRAIVVGQGMTIHDVNEKAASELAIGRFMAESNGRLRLRDQLQHLELARAVDRLIGNRSAGPETLVFLDEDRRQVVKVSPIGSNLSGVPLRLFPLQPQVLVLFRDVMQADRVDPSFARTYQLTPAEMKLCDGLLSGLSLAEIAGSHAIVIGTARHRLKAIFAKTGTNRQVELVRLMSAFG